MSEAPSISVILAAHDEAGSIAEVVRGCFAETRGLLELLVIDDGSTDDTARLAAEAGATVHRLPENRGKGAAIRHGLLHARGDVLLFMDADGQDDPRDIPALLDAIAGGADMVVGSRFLGRFERGAITPLNRAGNRLLTEIVNALFAVRLTDTQAGFRAVRRESAEACRLSAQRYDIEVDLLLGVIRNGGRVAEVPVRRLPRAAGTTDLDSFRDGGRILLRILRKRLAREPGRTRP